ncbi:hypothetical protein [Desulfopila sp. IMCC35008]|uniref:hypothetical protein n=1 Tax=Desulfopila sp. IMCC35008 TaxID=2653858 RepID=UPI0013D4F3FE|nr:hypothetical protein [Desulfopila sp. IMCC35008]
MKRIVLYLPILFVGCCLGYFFHVEAASSEFAGFVFKNGASETEHRIVNIASQNFPQVSWQSELIVLADINCDSIEDAAIIGIEKDDVLLFLWVGPQQNSSSTETLRFGLGDPTSQVALCSNTPRLMMEDQKYDLFEELGENPVGYKTSERCKGLKLYDDLCDSFHIYWNHKTNSLSFFRL